MTAPCSEERRLRSRSVIDKTTSGSKRCPRRSPGSTYTPPPVSSIELNLDHRPSLRLPAPQDSFRSLLTEDRSEKKGAFPEPKLKLNLPPNATKRSDNGSTSHCEASVASAPTVPSPRRIKKSSPCARSSDHMESPHKEQLSSTSQHTTHTAPEVRRKKRPVKKRPTNAEGKPLPHRASKAPPRPKLCQQATQRPTRAAPRPALVKQASADFDDVPWSSTGANKSQKPSKSTRDILAQVEFEFCDDFDPMPLTKTRAEERSCHSRSSRRSRSRPPPTSIRGRERCRSNSVTPDERHPRTRTSSSRRSLSLSRSSPDDKIVLPTKDAEHKDTAKGMHAPRLFSLLSRTRMHSLAPNGQRAREGLPYGNKEGSLRRIVDKALNV